MKQTLDGTDANDINDNQITEIINKSVLNDQKTIESLRKELFNDKKDFKKYPRNLNIYIIILKKLKVNYVFIPSIKLKA